MILFAMLFVAPAQPTEIAEILVTGRGIDRQAEDPTSTVAILSRQDMRREASDRLENLLENVAGVQGFRRSDARSAHPTSQSITMRGLGGNASSRALLILDGVPQGDPFGGWVLFPAFALNRLGSVRVTRGGGSSLWGPGALAGTIELESATPGQLGPASGTIAVGSRGTIEADMGVLGTWDGGFAAGSLSFSRSDGFVPIVRGDRGPIDLRAARRTLNAAVRAVTELAPRTELQVAFTRVDDRRDRGVPNTDNRTRATDGSVRMVGRGRLGWSLLGYIQRRRFSSEFASVDAARSTSNLTLDQYAVPATGWGGRAEFLRDGSLALHAGVDLRGVSGETREYFQFVGGEPTRHRIAGGRSVTFGAFADGTVKHGPLALNLSSRIDRWSISDGQAREQLVEGAEISRVRFAARSGVQATGRIGISLRTSKLVMLRASAYRGWRLPTLNELYRPFRVGADATAANADLNPEVSTGAEAGLSARLSPALTLDLTAFAIRMDHAIANVTIAQGPGLFPGVGFVSAAGSYRRRENVDSIRSRGVEAALSASSGPFEARLSYAFAAARVRDHEFASVDGRRPAQVPRHQLSGSIDWTGSSLYAGVNARLVSGQFEDDSNLRRLARAFTVDAVLSRTIGSRATISFRGENLTRARVETGVSERGEVERGSPRSLWISLTLGLPNAR